MWKQMTFVLGYTIIFSYTFFDSLFVPTDVMKSILLLFSSKEKTSFYDCIVIYLFFLPLLLYTMLYIYIYIYTYIYILYTVRKRIERVYHLDRSLLLKDCKPKRKDSIPFSVTYNSVLPNIKEIINKHWDILNIDSSFKEIFNSLQLMIAFRKNTSLKQLIGTNTIRNNQKFLTPTQTTTAGQCTPCYTSRSLCCQQVLKTTTFTSTQTRETFTIFHQVTCHSNYVIYLLECIMCKIQYVGKSETFNIRLNNHRKDIKNQTPLKHVNISITMNTHSVNMANLW